MKSSITFQKFFSQDAEEMTLSAQVIASREDTLELLALGTHSVLQALDVDLIEYLELLMEASDTARLSRTVVDTSLILKLRNE